ncbi:AlpA family transcriptional regulator [Actinoplanes sp. ATCC 53533]|uniref:helix-turn-helix transcriptional regulator n=1 Tax=Actinoplanes sp. ATCC 53533 TaxID=1288362 RepID=UPI001F3789E9|nr:helix-turn-helix domain-containing protein [Actinoplanes sp. ATCC 53533]
MPRCGALKRKLAATSDNVRRSNAEEILTLDEVAQLLKVPVGTLRKWRTDGEGPKGFRAGEYIRYRRSAVEQFIAEQERREGGC